MRIGKTKTSKSQLYAGLNQESQPVFHNDSIAVYLSGQFYSEEDWNGDTAIWLHQSGQILLYCGEPEALVKLQVEVIPAPRGSCAPLGLSIMQGELSLFKDSSVSINQKLDLFVSVREGYNPLLLEVEGEVLSPFETVGEKDARKLSFCFLNLHCTVMA